jgi:prolyl-tRNA synthetase
MKVDKSNFSEWYNKVVRLVVDDRYNLKGMVIVKPWGVKILDFIYRKFEELLEENGHQKVIFPVLIPEKNFEKEKEHVEGFAPEVFWVTEAGDKKLNERLALRPTSESAFYPMYSLWINGIKDLPLKLYQEGAVYRHETKATKPLIRGREFYWIETHDAFATEEEAKKQVEKDEEIIKEIAKMLCIPFKFFKRPEWDKFAGAVDTFAADTIMPDGRRLQFATTHYLGQNFAKAYDVKYKNSEGGFSYVYQTCFGPGIYRMLAAVISIHGDEYGMVLPFSIAPYQVVIVPIGVDVTEIYEKIKNLGIRVYLDDSDETPGEKFYKWEELGVPFRVEIGKKELEEGTLTVFRRDKRERVKIKDVDELLKLAEDYDDNLRKKAEEYFESMIVDINSEDDLKSLEKVGRIELCNECLNSFEDKYELNVFGFTDEKPKGKCAICGKPADVVTYVGRSY